MQYRMNRSWTRVGSMNTLHSSSPANSRTLIAERRYRHQQRPAEANIATNIRIRPHPSLEIPAMVVSELSASGTNFASSTSASTYQMLNAFRVVRGNTSMKLT